MKLTGGVYEEWDLAIQRLETHEENVEHPYLDTKGHLTIGRGIMIGSKKKFLELDLEYPDKDENGQDIMRPATREEKEAAWDALDPIPAGGEERNLNVTAAGYEKKTQVRLSKAQGDVLFYQRLLKAREDAVREIGEENYKALTIPQRAAAINIAFNVGSLSKYPMFVDAAKRGDGIGMAREVLAKTAETADGLLRHNKNRSRDNFCDSAGFGGDKCEVAFDLFLDNQTKFERRTEQDRSDENKYVAPTGTTPDTGEISALEDRRLRFVPPSSQSAPQQPAPARPGAAAQPQQPQQPEDERVRPGRNQPPNPGQAPQAGPAPRPGQAPPGQPRPGQPVQGPGQGLDQVPGQRPAQGPVPPAGAPVPPPPARGPGRGDERGSLSPEDGFGKLADIPANDVAGKDDRDGRQGTPMRMELRTDLGPRCVSRRGRGAYGGAEPGR